jgi:hypothetical protein
MAARFSPRLVQYRRAALMMNLKQEFDALIKSTTAFANEVKRREPVPDLSVADTSKPIPPPVIPET